MWEVPLSGFRAAKRFLAHTARTDLLASEETVFWRAAECAALGDLFKAILSDNTLE